MLTSQTALCVTDVDNVLGNTLKHPLPLRHYRQGCTFTTLHSPTYLEREEKSLTSDARLLIHYAKQLAEVSDLVVND